MVLTTEHRVAPVDAPREQCHAFARCGVTAQRGQFERFEIGRAQYLLPDRFAAKCRIGTVIGDIAIVVGEADKPHILNPVTLARGDRKDHGLRKIMIVVARQAHARIVGRAAWDHFDSWRYRLQTRCI